MNGDQESQWRYYDGICLTDLQVGQEPTIDVLIPSLSPAALAGPVASGTTEHNPSFFDQNGVAKQSNTTTANHVKAKWYGHSNNSYPPLVRKNEQVIVKQYGNSDQYYWEAEGRDSRLRTLDRVRFEVSATPHVGVPNGDDNTYFVEMDAPNGKLRLKTSKANDEPFAYLIHIDTKIGQLTITDDKSGDRGPNKIFIDSKNNIVHLSNNDGTTYHADGKDLTIQAPESISVKAGKQIYFESPIYTFNKSVDGKAVMVFNVPYMTCNTRSYVTNGTTIGYNVASLKLTGSLIAGGVRSPTIVNGEVGGSYASSSTDVQAGTGSVVMPTADTDTSGSGDREATAFEDFVSTVDQICAQLQIVASAAKCSIDTSGIKQAAKKAIMKYVKGY